MIITGRRISPRLTGWGITLAFFCIYASISLFNHYAFRTAAFDLGIKNQAVWDYAHFRYNYNTIMPELHGEVNNLANHFEPVLFLVSPLYWIFGSYTLLVVQLVFIVIGGWGIYEYVRSLKGSDYLPPVAMATFYATWGIFAAISFDFHTNVLAAMLMPWLIVFIGRGDFIKAFITWFLLVNCKENMALWAVFIGLGLIWHFRRERKKRMAGGVIALFSVVYFVLIMKVFMPYYAQGRLAYMHFSYAALGGNMSEALHTILTRPLYAFGLLFTDHVPDHGYMKNLKWNTYLFILYSGGFLLLFRPQFLVMLIPILAQKMYSDDPLKWSMYNQYSIELVPVIILAAFSVISSARDRRIQIAAGLLLFLSSFDTTKAFLDMWQPTYYYKTVNNFYKKEHYRREIPVKHIHRLLNDRIPGDAAVSATFYLVPHLADRRHIYQFPDVQQADYVVWSYDGLGTYPLDSAGYVNTIQELEQNGQWTVEYEEQNFRILKRIQAPDAR